MAKLLPFVFLVSFVCLFGLWWIVVAQDPDTAPFYIFGFFVFLLFVVVWGFLGLILYFVRTRLYKRYNPNWYFGTSFKMAFFVALFIGIAAVLAFLDLVSTLNVTLTIVALGLFAVWSYLGKK
jgi:hypothetical protein